MTTEEREKGHFLVIFQICSLKMATKKRSKKKGTLMPPNDQNVTGKKRDKKLKDPNHVHESKGQSKALRYLKLWYADKKGKSEEPWKFEKCRQIWLLQNCYDKTKVSKDDFKLLLKYMATIKGRMRKIALGKDNVQHTHYIYILRNAHT